MAGTSISLPTELELELEQWAYDEHRSKSEVVQDALRLYGNEKKKKSNKIAQQKSA